MRPLRWFGLALTAALLPGWSPSAWAANWVVGPAPHLTSVAEALRRAADGDVVEVMPGTYRGDVAVITQRRLTIRGVGARPVLSADGRHAEGKAIWVVRDGDITVENIEFRGARVPDLNGAGIRFEKGRLRIVRCAFFDNEMGLLTANFGDAELRIEDSEFGLAPRHAGSLHHLLYVGRIARVEVTGSRFHQGHLGHLMKSRARESVITGNSLVDGPMGQASYEIDLPNGGRARVSGNTIGQGDGADNLVLVAFGAEGSAWPDSALTMEDNTLVNEASRPAWFLRVWPERLPDGAPVVVRRNRLVGPGRLAPGAAAVVDGNTAVPRP